MSEKDIIHKLSLELDFERSKMKTFQAELQAKEQECKELKKDKEMLLQTIIKDQSEIVQKNINETNILLIKENTDLQQQLDQLKAENEELKKANKHIEHNRNQKADKLMRIEKLITACSTGYTDEFIQELLVILHEPEPNSFENKHKAILAEIKEMLKEICIEECSFDWKKTSKKHCGDCDCRYGQILQKISECEVKNEI